LGALSCSGLFDPPPATEYTFLSLGAGVQSSCLALMAAKGEITPMPNAAIFADTQAEPKSVYRWLDWLQTQLPFPVIRVTRGDLTAESLQINPFKSDPTRSWVKALIPAFLENPDGSKSLMGRQCTFRYKVEMLERTARQLAGIKRGQRKVTVTQWIGISWDELQRMKLPRKPWTQHRWPLIERRMTRRHCLEWMEVNGYPEPPRSACIYCPFHTNAQWRRMKDEEPEEFDRAVKFERDLDNAMKATNQKAVKPYLHASLTPLDQVDFSTDTERGQGAFDFQAECEGMCGV
jgi:3'-phosphoadenosine 5'-phosphosulfate sulfotransferase (PAPS reductase)/FAD synthetase